MEQELMEQRQAEQKKVLRYLVQKIERNQEEMERSDNKEDALALLFDESFERFSERIVSNLRILIHYFYVEKGAGIQDVIAGVRRLIERVKDPFDLEQNKTEAQDGFDDKFGTKTSASIEQFELEEEISVYRWIHSARYIPSPVKSVTFALDFLTNLKIDYSKYTFIDVGSGMGRNLLIASEYPFRKVVGIEISSYLHETAEANIRIYKTETQKCKDIRSYCRDILDFESLDEYTIFYFWEPVSESVFDRFFLKLLEMISAGNQKVILMFLGRPYRALKVSKVFKLREMFLTQDKIGESDSFLMSIYSTGNI